MQSKSRSSTFLQPKTRSISSPQQKMKTSHSSTKTIPTTVGSTAILLLLALLLCSTTTVLAQADGDEASTTTTTTSTAPVDDAATTAAAEDDEGPEPFQQLWTAHGWLMAISWVILLPIGIGSSMLRQLIPGHGTWFQIHMICNTLGFILMTIGFAFAVYIYQQNEDDHFQERHQAVGLAVYLISFAQVLAGIFRPHLPHPQDEDEEIIHHHHEHEHEMTEDTENRSGGFENGNGTPDKVKPVKKVAPPQKSTVRKVFEVIHPFMGLGLVGLAWYNVYLGIGLITEFYGPTYDKTDALWGVIGGLGGFIFVTYVALKVRDYKTNKSTNKDQAINL